MSPMSFSKAANFFATIANFFNYSNAAQVDDVCEKCRYPICPSCKSDSKSHSDLCVWLAKDKGKFNFEFTQRLTDSAYQAILPLRLSLLEDNSLMTLLMDHLEEQQKTAYWAEVKTEVVDRIASLNPSIDPAEVFRIVGILETNAYEIYGNATVGFRGLFPLVKHFSLY